ncbi:hypothetical protein PGT21_033035 [Puccinia graminis f. sp. tritici]|uniref:Uncharacterized protein n=1 Tax=Puccinia graminis f. sp. tritici TaxID=56615 RepID=A0A5B0LZN1_PUCGR|nr:hypothetical protein PGT21_033035 [Puccinia graminis f. sp. tritici]
MLYLAKEIEAWVWLAGVGIGASTPKQPCGFGGDLNVPGRLADGPQDVLDGFSQILQ